MKKFDNYVKFYDSVDLKPIGITSKIKDFYNNTNNQQSLRVKIAATHSGKITRNNGFYLPHKMKAGASTFTHPYKKPIQLHHGDHADPVGRAIHAEYVDTSRMIRDSWDKKNLQDSARPISDTLLDAFCAGKLNTKESLEIIDNYFIRNSSIVEDPDYQGLGYIELIANITDPDAIQKILDERFLTGSVGASTNAAICNICKQDWAKEDGRCEHVPGKIYDEKGKCVLIAGDFVYDEWSFVNRPADTHASIIEINVGGIQDFVEIDKIKEENIPEVSFSVIDHENEQEKKNQSEEDKSMKVKDALTLVSKDEKYKDIKGIKNIVKNIFDENKELDEEKLFTLLSDAIKTEDSKEEKDDNLTIEDKMKTFWKDEYEDIIGDNVEEGKLYLEMIMTLLEDVAEEDLEPVEKQLRDAKLSAKQRKELVSTSFCGPERSFPVNDCAHYTAALRLISRYNGPGDKDSIRACVLRKGKRLGCQSKESSDSVDCGQYNADYFDHFEDEQLLQLQEGLNLVFDERNIPGQLCENVALEDQVKQLRTKISQLEAELLEKQDSVSTNKEIEELKDKLDVARKENRYLHEDIENLQKQLSDNLSLVRDEKYSRIKDFYTLKDKDTNFEKIQTELDEKSSEELDEILKDLTTQVDIKKIADTLKSGLSNNPTGTVTDPTLLDNNKTKEVKVTKETLQKIRDKYMFLRMKPNGQVLAAKFIQDCKQRGLIPENYLVQDKS